MFDDYPQAIAVDANAHVYVTGYAHGDYATVAYSSGGLPLWTNIYDGPANSDDQAFAIAVDGSGNVYVTGHSVGTNASYDYATIAYSSSGMPMVSSKWL